MWASPGHDEVRVLDVRTPEEYAFVGHPEMAMCIPFMMHTYQWDPDKGRVVIEMNPRFMSEVQSWVDPSDTILVMCRSGGRAAMAVDALADAGYTNVYNILEGMEGVRVNDPNSRLPPQADGQRLEERRITMDLRPRPGTDEVADEVTCRCMRNS